MVTRAAFREQVHNLVVQMQQTFRNRKADGGGSEGLGHGIEDVRRVGDEELFLQHPAVLKDHHAVQVFGAVGDGLKIGSEGFVKTCGGFGARERAGRAGAGGGEHDGQEKDNAFHTITIGISEPNILI